MKHPFIDFLGTHDLIPEAAAKQLAARKNMIREPLGMIAVSHGMLMPNQIDVILDRQRECKAKRFGEIAVELGYLTPQQVDNLVRVQEFRVAVDIAESLALAGVLSCADAAQYLGNYLVGDRELAEMITDP